MKLAELLQPWVNTVIPDSDIFGLQNDSRQVKPGDLFFAYPGALFDGRQYIHAAIHAGAAAVIYDSNGWLPTLLPNEIPCLPIPDLAKKRAAIASHFYHHPAQHLSITGITGTNGKTTIAYQLAQAHNLLGNRASYIGTLGQGDIHHLQPLANTTPDGLCLQQLFYQYVKEGIKKVCMEVSSHAIGEGRIDQIDFTQAIYTNLSHEHLDYHHTMEAYAETKSRLFSTPSLKQAIINQDDNYSELMAQRLNSSCQKITYGFQNDADVRAVNSQVSLMGSEVEVESPWGKHHLLIKSLGKFNIYNSLAIFTSLLLNDYSPEDVVDLMPKLQETPGRMEVVSQEPYVIVDYAHTPDALENVLSTLAQLKQGKIWVVFGCGGDRDKAKRPMMGYVAKQHADFVIITSDNPRTENPEKILDEIAQGLPNSESILKIVDRKEAINKAISLANKEDIILVAGKGHEAYQQIGNERLVFSDQDMVRQLLSSPH